MEYAKSQNKKIKILVAWLSFCLILILTAMHAKAGANSYLLPQSSSVCNKNSEWSSDISGNFFMK